MGVVVESGCGFTCVPLHNPPFQNPVYGQVMALRMRSRLTIQHSADITVRPSPLLQAIRTYSLA